MRAEHIIISFCFKPGSATFGCTPGREVAVSTVAVGTEIGKLDVEGTGFVPYIFEFNRDYFLLSREAFNPVSQSALHGDLAVRPVANTEC